MILSCIIPLLYLLTNTTTCMMNYNGITISDFLPYLVQNAVKAVLEWRRMPCLIKVCFMAYQTPRCSRLLTCTFHNSTMPIRPPSIIPQSRQRLLYLLNTTSLCRGSNCPSILTGMFRASGSLPSSLFISKNQNLTIDLQTLSPRHSSSTELDI